MSRKVRVNSSISKVWDTLRTAQKYHALRAAGVDDKKAEGYSLSDWGDMSPEIKGMLLAGWNMSTIGGTTRRYKSGGTTRRMPVMVNRSRRNPVSKPFEMEGSHTYAVSSKGGGWHIYETYKTYEDALDWAKYIMKEGIPGVRGNVQALILRPTGERSYSVYWRNVRRVASNPVPLWMQSDEAFQRVVGVSIKEWQNIFRSLPDWKKKEFHRRAGKKILSANAMKWVVEQGAPASIKNRPQVPIEVKGETQAMRLSGFLRKRGVRIQIKRVASRPGWFTFHVPSSQAELAENLLYKWMHEADPYERPVKKALASERRWKLRQHRRKHRRGIRRGGYMFGGKPITEDRRLPNPGSKRNLFGVDRLVIATFPDSDRAMALITKLTKRGVPDAWWRTGQSGRIVVTVPEKYAPLARALRKSIRVNPAGNRIWYVGMYQTGRGMAWWTSESKATLMKKPIVGNILKISAPTSSKAIEEAWKHRRRLGL